MDEENIIIEDDSGDKNYFTIIPNYIANHSTANDQSLYFQMKRFAGEKGICFASEKTLRQKMGIGRNALKKSIAYLISHNWIKEKGIKKIITKGGEQNVKVYSIVNIWKLNNESYKGVSETAHLNDKGVSRTAQGGVQNDIKGVSRTAPNKNHSKEPYKDTEQSSETSGLVINLFKEINPSYKNLFKRKVQHDSAKRLLEREGYEKLSKIVKFVEMRKIDKFCPQISSPYQLEEKWSALEKYALGLKGEINKFKVAF